MNTKTVVSLRQNERLGRWLAAGLLLLFFGRLLTAANQKSVTYDEVLHLYQGALYWREQIVYGVVQNPPLINAIIGVPLRLLFAPQFPPSLALVSDWLKLSQTFMWQSNENGLQLIWAGRLAIMWLSLLLGALIFRWSSQLFHTAWAGLFALLLYTFDPNILAHSYLATTDIGLAFFLTAAAYLIWRYWRQSDSMRWGFYLLTGMAVGGLFAAKFSGVLIVPAVVIIAVYRWGTTSGKRPSLSRMILQMIGWFLIGGLVFLIAYRFSWQTISLDFTLQRNHQLGSHASYLLGELGRGWWYYFPIVFLVKTPIATLFLSLLGVILFFVRRQFLDWQKVWPWLLTTAVFGGAIVSGVNIGYRYLLGGLPFLFISLGQLAKPGFLQVRAVRWTAAGAAMLLVLVSLRAHPHYLAYFNQFAGGPDNGWRIAVDSNIDWGQDLQLLADYMAENNLDSIKANWLGAAPLSAYGINGEVIVGWPAIKDRGDIMMYDWFYPDEPAPGTYALSVTQLMGVYLKSDKTRFRAFQAQEPVGKAGYSIFIYDVPANGPPVGLALSGIGISTIAKDDYAQFGSNDVTPRWFDARAALLWPGGRAESTWTVIGEGHVPSHALLQQLYPASGPVLSGAQTVNEQEWRYLFFDWPESPVQQALKTGENVMTDFGWSAEPHLGARRWDEGKIELETAVFDDKLQFLGYQLGAWEAERPLDLLTFWRVQQTPEQNLKIFVHLIDGDGNIIAQHDGLDVRIDGLQPGDEFAQLHTIQLPDNIPAGTYALQVGVYRAESGMRLPLTGLPADRVLLHSFSVSTP